MNIGPFTGSKNFLATASVSLKNLEHATCNYFCFAGFYGSNMLLEILVAVLFSLVSVISYSCFSQMLRRGPTASALSTDWLNPEKADGGTTPMDYIQDQTLM